MLRQAKQHDTATSKSLTKTDSIRDVMLLSSVEELRKF